MIQIGTQTYVLDDPIVIATLVAAAVTILIVVLLIFAVQIGRAHV